MLVRLRTIGAWALAAGLTVTSLACGHKSSGSGSADPEQNCLASLTRAEKDWGAIAGTDGKNESARAAAEAAATAAASIRAWREHPDNADARKKAEDDSQKARDAAEKAQAVGAQSVSGAKALGISARAAAACSLLLKK